MEQKLKRKKWGRFWLVIVWMLSYPLAAWAVPPVSGYLGGPNTPDLPGVLLTIINTFLLLASVLALAFIIIGGFRYITSSGNQDDIEQAKRTVMYAVVGLLVIIVAAAIVNFVIFSAAGSPGVV